MLCPICADCDLVQTGSVIHCACGLRVETRSREGFYDGVSLDALRGRLAAAFQAHTDKASHCEHQPRFNHEHRFGIDMLTMTCAGCNFLHIVV